MVGVGGAEYYRKLRDAGILVRYYSNPRIENFVRITIGTDDQMDEVIRVTKEILSDREGK
jgi:histidinol-phosphate aminotransferase